MSNDSNSNSRYQYRTKRKKTNFILNGLIVIVLLLIVFVAYTIFSSGNDKATSKKTTGQKIAADHTTALKKKKTANDNTSDVQSASTDENKNSDSSAEETAGTTPADNSQEEVTQGGNQPDTQQTITNPDWKPVGTTQSGEHSPVYDSNSTDWKEMLKAVSYATGLDQANMTIWFLGRDKSGESDSVGTVSSKDKQQKFRVYLKWVDGDGWKPTKVEVLSQIN